MKLMELGCLLAVKLTFICRKTTAEQNLHKYDLESISSTAMNTLADEKITEYFTAIINVTYIDTKNRRILTSAEDIGRYSSAGSEPVSGVATLLLSQNENLTLSETGCHEPLLFQKLGVPTIAVIKRGLCTFDKKVENAEKMGAVGVLIYDNEKSDKLKSIQVGTGRIPTVFTNMEKGEEIVNLIKDKDKVFLSMWEGSHCWNQNQTDKQKMVCTSIQKIFHQQNHDSASKTTLKPREEMPSSAVILISVSFTGIMVVSISLLLLYYHYRIKQMHDTEVMDRRLGRKTKQALNHVSLYNATGTEGDCSVCIEQISSGAEVRQLPCSHMFHRPCIDDWLLKRRKCPLCNLNIVEHFGLLELEDSSSSYEASGIAL